MWRRFLPFLRVLDSWLGQVCERDVLWRLLLRTTSASSLQNNKKENQYSMHYCSAYSRLYGICCDQSRALSAVLVVIIINWAVEIHILVLMRFYATRHKMGRGHLVFALSVILSFRHSVLPSHQSLSSQLLLHTCMDLNETWYRCCTTSVEMHVGR